MSRLTRVYGVCSSCSDHRRVTGDPFSLPHVLSPETSSSTPVTPPPSCPSLSHSSSNSWFYDTSGVCVHVHTDPGRPLSGSLFPRFLGVVKGPNSSPPHPPSQSRPPSRRPLFRREQKFDDVVLVSGSGDSVRKSCGGR